MDKKSLPPIVEEITNGEVIWKHLGEIDYETLGYFLSCHLIIEHYLDEYLKTCYPDLDWDSARNTFAQKIALLSKMNFPSKYNSVPAIKHMNSIRNKISHNINHKIEMSNFGPMIDYVVKGSDGRIQISAETKEFLEQFTGLVCVWFAGCIYQHADTTKLTR